MKKKVKLLLGLIALPLLISAQNRACINFESQLSWAQIQDKAKSENRYIFVDLFATWCGPCKMMDRDVYCNDTVAEYMNDKFISVKLQMDSTGADNEYVRSMYSTVKQFASKYKIQGYPSFLCFTPNGLLVLEDIGYHNVGDFMSMINQSLDPTRAQYYSFLQNYKVGQKDYLTMGDLALFAKKVAKDEQLSEIIAKDYKENYLDRLSEEKIMNRKALDFIGEFFTLINSGDKFFKACYERPEKIDEIKNYPGWADFQVRETINREDLSGVLLKNGMPIYKNPNWTQISATIKKKYYKVNAEELVIDYQIEYYHQYDKNWKKWCEYQDQKIKKTYGKLQKEDAFWKINLPAWDAFQHCNNKSVLKTALKWCELDLSKDPFDVQCMDTKSNLLYKLGRQVEAINQEEKAIDTSGAIAVSKNKEKETGPFYQAFIETVQKMKKGEPTWPIN